MLRKIMICLGVAGTFRLTYEAVGIFLQFKVFSHLSGHWQIGLELFLAFWLTAALLLFAYAAMDHWSRSKNL